MKKKEKMKENKVWKWFRHLASLGIGGAVLFLFPNFVITQLSFLVGILVGKGLISASLGFAITTFLGSQAGLWVQKGLLALLSYIISNLTLKLGGKLAALLKNNKENKTEIKNQNLENNCKQSEKNNALNISIDKTVEYINHVEDSVEFKPNSQTYVKRLGKHPSYRK